MKKLLAQSQSSSFTTFQITLNQDPEFSQGSYLELGGGSELRFQEELGKGGFGKVILGSLSDETRSQVEVACKVASKPKARRELIQEAALLSQLAHDNIVSIVGFIAISRNHDIIPIVMLELCDASLDSCLEQFETGKDVLRGITDISKALEYCQKIRIVHRDIKPANVLVKNGRCKIGDFGLAATLPDGQLRLAEYKYSSQLRYMPPEISGREGASVKSDAWGIGLILYELIAKQALIDKNDQTKYYKTVTHIAGRFDDPKYYENRAKHLDTLPNAKDFGFHQFHLEFLGKEQKTDVLTQSRLRLLRSSQKRSRMAPASTPASQLMSLKPEFKSKLYRLFSNENQLQVALGIFDMTLTHHDFRCTAMDISVKLSALEASEE